MNLLFVHQAFMTGNEAGGTRHYELAQRLVRAGHRFTAIASTISYLTGQRHDPDAESSDPSAAIAVCRVYTYSALHQSFVHRVVSFMSFMVSSLLKGLWIKNVDIVWGTSPPIFQGLTTWLLARAKRVPFLFEVRDLWPAFAIDMGVLRNPALIWIAERLELFLYRRADHIIVNSPAYVNHVESKEISPKKITLIPNGVETAMFDPSADGAQVRQDLGLGDRFVLLYAGAHGPANDLEVVLEAAHRLKDREDIAFVLVGDGKDKPRLIQQAQDLGLENVLFVDAQPKARMPDFLSAADAGLAILQNIPMFTTTYPNKVFDYMAAGRPTVLAIDGVIREVVEAAQGGVFVPPGDPDALAQTVCNLADDRAHCAQMGQAARVYVKEHFERAQQADKLTELLGSIVNGERN